MKVLLQKGKAFIRWDDVVRSTQGWQGTGNLSNSFRVRCLPVAVIS